METAGLQKWSVEAAGIAKKVRGGCNIAKNDLWRLLDRQKSPRRLQHRKNDPWRLLDCQKNPSRLQHRKNNPWRLLDRQKSPQRVHKEAHVVHELLEHFRNKKYCTKFRNRPKFFIQSEVVEDRGWSILSKSIIRHQDQFVEVSTNDLRRF